MNEIKSPCNGICIIDEDTYLCVGCHRTSEEISKWDSLDNIEKIEVLEKVKLREAKNNEKS